MWTHAETYQGFGFDKLIHRGRLRAILQVLGEARLGPAGDWADFGCSDGYILDIVRSRLAGDGWRLHGFDHSLPLLEEGRKRGIAGARFEVFDLNRPDRRLANSFDVVTCFETLEHTGHFRNALDNLLGAARPGGLVVVSVPNEVGLPGLIKFTGRAVLRRNPYGDFFRERSALRYTLRLLVGADLEPFRIPAADAWGVHLGFDYRNFESYLRTRWLAPGTCELPRRHRPFPGFNLIYALRKLRATS